MIRIAIAIISLFAMGATNLSCGGPTVANTADSLFLINNASDYYYDLKRPTEKYFLPYVLSEVSGLTYLSPNKLMAVEDEGGRAYIYDLNIRDIIHSIKFWTPGDFEGVEVVNDEVFVLKSDGDIFRFDYTLEKEAVPEKIETPLGDDNDTEGLGYDVVTNSLLIACKEEGDTKENEVKGRAIYSYDLDKNKFEKKEFFNITTKGIKEFFEANKPRVYDEKKIKFKPSAIAYHPLEGTFYILASVGKLMIVVDKKGNILQTYPIMARVLNQPEGICFAPNGDMFISSEGEGDRGYILKYPRLKR